MHIGGSFHEWAKSHAFADVTELHYGIQTMQATIEAKMTRGMQVVPPLWSH